MSVYYIDGQFVQADQASVPAHDLALLRGYGVFDFLRTYNGKPFKLAEHIQRLAQSAALIGMDELPWSQHEICDIIMQTLSHNAYPESNIRIVVTGGDSFDFITPEDKPRLLVLVTPARELPQTWYTDGAKVVTVTEERYLPTAKSINYIPAILALKKARKESAIEALYVDRNRHLLEGTTTNYFAFIGDQLVTPHEGVLPGITRHFMLRLLDGVFDVEVRDMQLDEVYTADEVFLTASNKEVVPIVRIDDHTIADGRPGPRTRQVMDLFREATRKFANGS